MLCYISHFISRLWLVVLHECQLFSEVFVFCVVFKVDFSLLFLLYFYWFIPSRWFPFLFNNTGATTRTTAIIILLLVKLIFGCWLVSFCDRLDGSLIYLIFQILSLFYGGERADRRIVKHNGTRRRWQELMKKKETSLHNHVVI